MSRRATLTDTRLPVSFHHTAIILGYPRIDVTPAVSCRCQLSVNVPPPPIRPAHGANRVLITELIMAVGLVVDYVIHIVHYSLHQVPPSSEH